MQKLKPLLQSYVMNTTIRTNKVPLSVTPLDKGIGDRIDAFPHHRILGSGSQEAGDAGEQYHVTIVHRPGRATHRRRRSPRTSAQWSTGAEAESTDDDILERSHDRSPTFFCNLE